MSETNSHTDNQKVGPTASQKVLPVFSTDPSADGRGEELADRRAEARHRIRVLNSVRYFMKGKRKRHGR